MILSEGEDEDDHLYTQMKNCNLTYEKQQSWQPIDGVGQLSDEHFVGNYMTDSSQTFVEKTGNESQTNLVQSKILSRAIQSSRKNVHHLDISEYRALSTDEYLSDICVSHIESTILAYIMTENDHRRAIELQRSLRCIETVENHQIFKPIENRLCAVKNNNEWIRARCLAVSKDKQIVKVQYIDWGNIVHLQSKDLRSLPQEFYQESSCCISCRLDGVDDVPFDTKIVELYNKVLIGSNRDNFDLSMIVTKASRINEHPHVVLYRKSTNLNDQIYKSLPPKKTLTTVEHLVAQFTYELPLMVGEEYRALLSSHPGTDGSFYILIDHNNYNQFIEKNLNRITDDFQAPVLLRPLMMICVKYDGKYSRAWIKSIDSFSREKNSLDLDEKYQVFYVDWGNEELVTLDRIRTCPESIRYIPWLANRVKFYREQLTAEEFDEFWKTVEGDYCQIVVIDQCNDHYSVEIKYDHLSTVRKRRAIAFINNNC